MLKAMNLPCECFGGNWRVGSFSGNLYKDISASDNSPPFLPEKLDSALRFVEHPFNIGQTTTPEPTAKVVDGNAAESVLSRIRMIPPQAFWFLRLYSGIEKPLFDCGIEAFDYLNEKTDLTSTSDCLYRSCFVAKTSASFRKSGVLFIGAFLPSYQMHAWIIESNNQPDTTDRSWINYRPILALF